MPDQITSTIARNIRDFHLPRYEDIPNVGLYLEQTVSYITEYLNPIQKGAITGSMAEAYFHVPVELAEKAFRYLPKDILDIVDQYYSHMTDSVMSE